MIVSMVKYGTFFSIVAGYLPFLFLLFVGTQGLISCSRCTSETKKNPVRMSELTVADDTYWGGFLEKMPQISRRPFHGLRIIRAQETKGFNTDFRRIHVQSISLQSWERAAIMAAGPAVDGATFTYSCRDVSKPSIRGWITSQHEYEGRISVELEYNDKKLSLPVPDASSELKKYHFRLDPSFCQNSETQTVNLLVRHGAGAGTDIPDDAILMSPPTVLSRSEKPGRLAILISLDTMRRDYWDKKKNRPGALDQLYSDSIIFTKAYTSRTSTPSSHSVMLSGLFPEKAVSEPVEDERSFVSSLRHAGFSTLGFVAGGFMRANFGFNKEFPGFGTGFDIYVEDMLLKTGGQKEGCGNSARKYPEDRYRETHTLAPALERSLRWLSRYTGEDTFHFIHCFDVHEYRNVKRSYWDRAVENSAKSGVDLSKLSRCTKKLIFKAGDDYTMLRFAKKKLKGKKSLDDPIIACHRVVAKIMYEARLISIEDTLARYINALRKMGVYNRALIIVTSDHGESLFDEKGFVGRIKRGHNKLTAKNLEIPLWIKLPGKTSEGFKNENVAGLIDLRATIGPLLGLDIGKGRGVDLLNPDERRKGLLKFSTVNRGAGSVLPSGEICARRILKMNRKKTKWYRFYSNGQWVDYHESMPDICRSAFGQPDDNDEVISHPEIPAELVEELRALGYVE